MAVGPPLSARAPRPGSVTPAWSVGWACPHEPSLTTLPPRLVTRALVLHAGTAFALTRTEASRMTSWLYTVAPAIEEYPVTVVWTRCIESLANSAPS